MAEIDRFAVLWLVCLPGVLAFAWQGLPRALQNYSGPVSLRKIRLAWVIQLMIVSAGAVWAGLATSVDTGLHAPILDMLLQCHSHSEPMWGKLGYGLAGAVLGALILDGAKRYLPPFTMPLLVRLLYGGVVEEIIMRWGVMGVIAWSLLWLGDGYFADQSVVAAIILSSILFAAGHLPAARTIFGCLSTSMVMHILFWNFFFAVLAGVLFWLWGLETAIIFHVGAHLVAAIKPVVVRFARSLNVSI